MRLHNLAIALGAVGLLTAFTATPARADQVNLGNTTCTGGPVTVNSTPSLSGAAFNCTNDVTFSSTHGNQGTFNWSLSPASSSTATIMVFPGGTATTTTDWDITGTATWASGTFIGGPTSAFVLTGNLLVTAISGTNNPWYGEYVVGNSYAMDLTLTGCSVVAGGYSCSSPSSGEILTPEPSTVAMLLLGLMAVGLAGGFLRRRDVCTA